MVRYIFLKGVEKREVEVESANAAFIGDAGTEKKEEKPEHKNPTKVSTKKGGGGGGERGIE